MTKHKWRQLTLVALAGTSVLCGLQAVAQPLYWQPWTPTMARPGFINPPGFVVGGWWNAPHLGPSDITICRLDDHRLGRWSYGGFHSGACNYYSPISGHGHSINIGFDLLGGDDHLRWVPTSHHRNHNLWSDWEGNIKAGTSQGQIALAQNDELESLCRIVQADGAFIGTLRDETCFASWQGTEIISADYEIIERSEN
ncbi:MAG: hypothetical protein RIR26_1870 [Pseudomonadota bacterium]